MSFITAGEASSVLKISKRSLFRWEKDGRIRSVRDGILKVRVYDKKYIEMVKRILELNRMEREHLKKLPEIVERARTHLFAQDYIPGKPLKLSTTEEVDAAIKASEDEEAWMREHTRLLKELCAYPRDIIREVLAI